MWTLKIIPILLVTFLPKNFAFESSPLQLNPEPSFSLAEGQPNSRFDVPSGSHRLPLVVVPTNYDLTSRPIIFPPSPTDPSTDVPFTAPGTVAISVQCIATSTNITLHAFNLTISEVKVQHAENGSDLVVEGHDYSDLDKDFYTIELLSDNPIYLNYNYTIIIQYVAPISLTGQYLGLYLSQYEDSSKNIHFLSTTKFEPYHARKAFPAFDEPSLKAFYKITLARRKDAPYTEYHTLSNYPVKTTTEKPELPNWNWEEHEMSLVPMSTYQVTMIISDFKDQAADTSIEFGKDVKVWSAPHLIGGGVYPANLIAKVLKYYQERFDMEYHLPKMDSVAVPQFPSGAMEQWGLNTYRAEYLLYNEGLSTEVEKRRITSIISHELAHQWFGNAVTCAWWNDIYLNEGFATYLSFQAMDHVQPEFEGADRFFIDATAIAMKFDQGPSTHPIHHDAQIPSDISALFSDINYEKASCIIRMMEHVFGTPEAFDEALKVYLTNMSFKGAEQDDLFNFLETKKPIPDLTVKEFLDTWTLQSGYPILRVSRASKTRIYLSQEKFVLDPQNRNDMEENELDPNELWHIPIAISSKANPEVVKSPKVWLRKNQLTISYTTNVDTDAWLIVNPESAAYARVMYDRFLTAHIHEQLETDPNVFGAITRSQLIDDHFNFANAKYIMLEGALTFTKYLSKETELSPWTIVWNHLREAFIKFNDNEQEAGIFKDYFESKIGEALKSIKIEHQTGDNGALLILRPILLDYASAMGHVPVLNHARDLVKSWETGASPISVDYQAVHYCAATRSSEGDAAHDLLYEKYQLEVDPVNSPHRLRLLKAMACSPNPVKLQGLLNDAFNQSSVLDEDRVPMIQAVAGSREGRALVIPFIINNYGEGPLTPEAVVQIVGTMASLIGNSADIETLRKFVNETADVSTKPELNGHLGVMEANVQWRGNTGQTMLSWFELNK